MTAFVKVNNGAWNVASSWDVGVGWPSSSADTATIGTFATEIPSAVSITCGAITMTGTNSSSRSELTINGSLTLAGAMTLNSYTTLIFGPSFIIDINGNSILWVNSGASINRVTSNTTAANRGTIKSTATGGNIYRAAGVQSMDGTLKYIDFTDIGLIQMGSNFNAGDNFDASWNTFTGCDTVTLGGYREGSGDLIIEHNDFRNSTATTNASILSSRLNGTDTGTYSMKYNTWNCPNKVARFEYDIDVTGSVFIETTPSSVLTGTKVYNSLFVYSTASTNLPAFATSTANGTYVYTNFTSHTVENMIGTFEYGVVEADYYHLTDFADHFILSTTGSLTVQYTVVLDARGGVLLNALGTAKTGTYQAIHNTLVGQFVDNAYGFLARTESGGSFAGTLNLHSNIVYDASAQAGSLGINMDAGTPPDDMVTFMDMNNWYNIEDPYHGVTSATKTPGVTAGYGGNDTTHNPNFYDPTRNIATWDATYGSGTGTAAAAAAHFLKLNGYNAGSKTQVTGDIITVSPADLTTWVRAGYAPTNITLKDAGYDGITVGAVEYKALAIYGARGLTQRMKKRRSMKW